jgi:two-component sensor histidine kinase
MSPKTPSSVNARDTAFLYVSEILRIRSEYSRAISFASILTKKSNNQETKDALGEIITHLRAVAETHRVLRPPMIDGSVDLIDVISQLCDAVSASDFRRREIELSLGVCDPIFLEANRCWLVSLIVAELINNSFRHAFATRSGRIEVSLIVSDNLVLCNVSDNGSAAAPVTAGVGTGLVDALVAELDGVVERLFRGGGASVTLLFPIEASTALLSDGSRVASLQLFDNSK